MNILAFDTCMGAVSVALGWTGPADRPCLAHRWENRTTGHAERLFPMIAEVLAQAALPFAAIDRIAVTVGPGTFTGVRIAIAAARGFRVASNCDVVGVPSLEIMALTADRRLGAARAGYDLLVAVDARRGQVYAQYFGAAAPDRLAAPVLSTVEDVVASLPDVPLIVAGSGARTLAAYAAATRAIEAQALLDDLEPDAYDLLAIASNLMPMDSVHPLYIRAPDAKPPAAHTPLRA